MKSVTRTVLSTTLTSASSYSSGPLDVGDLYELLFTVDASSAPSSAQFQVSAIDANGNLYFIGQVDVSGGTTATQGLSIGAGFSGSFSSAISLAFGDQIQVDLVMPSGTITAQLSIKGK